MVQLVDVGLNLTHDSFDGDREQVIAAAEAAGVTRMIITGTSVSASEHAAALAGGDQRLYATAGIHPHHASGFDSAAVDRLRTLLAQPRVVAAGECGLDYFRDYSPRQDQQHCFAAQLELAAESGRPVFLHQRDAHEDLVRMLHPLRDRLSGGVAHCFTSGNKELHDYLDLDLYIGVTGWVCDERRGDALREAVPSIPLDRLLLETDAPYLLPRDLDERPRGRRNEPRFLPHILARVAALTGHPPDLLAEHATRNACQLFRLHDTQAEHVTS
jgi:TatD DNase family protein